MSRPSPSGEPPDETAEEKREVAGHPWRVVVAVCLQRFPRLCRESPPLEARVEALKEQTRLERSRLSDFELEEAAYLRVKRERERRALEEDIVEVHVRTYAVGTVKCLVGALLWWYCSSC